MYTSTFHLYNFELVFGDFNQKTPFPFSGPLLPGSDVEEALGRLCGFAQCLWQSEICLPRHHELGEGQLGHLAVSRGSQLFSAA